MLLSPVRVWAQRCDDGDDEGAEQAGASARIECWWRSVALTHAGLSQPKKWQLEIEQEANRANLEVDLVLDAQLEEMDAEGCDEHAEVTSVHELITDLYSAARTREAQSIPRLRG